MSHRATTVEEAARRTGYPFEFEAAKILRRNNWLLEEKYNYLDPDEGKSREIDIWAQRVPLVRDSLPLGEGTSFPPFFVAEALLECKKSYDCSLVVHPRLDQSYSLDIESQVLDFPSELGHRPPRIP